MANCVAGQDDSCLDYSNEKVVRLLEKAQNSSKYDRAERIAFIELAYSKDEECMACLLEWGKLEFAAAKKTGASFYAAREPLRELLANCPHYHADALYILGAMAYADRDYQEAKDYFSDYQDFPSDQLDKLGKRYAKQLAEVENVSSLIQFQLDFYRYEATSRSKSSRKSVFTRMSSFLPFLPMVLCCFSRDEERKKPRAMFSRGMLRRSTCPCVRMKHNALHPTWL